MKLLLFDIDGTLLLSGGAGRAALEQALNRHANRPLATDKVPFAGKTDPLIVREILEANGHPEASSGAFIERILTTYSRLLPDHLDPQQVRVLPGVRPLLERLASDPAVQLGLITGNLEPTATLKLEAAGLTHFFPFGGAFGSDHAERHLLPAIAVEAAEQYTGRDFTGGDVIIIGDTVHDVRCGTSIGARSVAVCTGRYDWAALSACQPDVLLENLEDAQAFYERVLLR